jgi:hypothetical protein
MPETAPSHHSGVSLSKSEMRFLRRESISDCLREGQTSLDAIIAFVREDEQERYGFELKAFTPWDGWDFGGGVDWDGPRFTSNHYDNEFPVYYDAQGREHAEF